MTKKEMFTFVDEKYDAIEKLMVAKHKKIINNFYDEQRKRRDACLQRAEEALLAELRASGDYENLDSESIRINFYNYKASVKLPKRAAEAAEQIQKIHADLKIEKQDFKDDLVLCGIKDPAAVLKLEVLRTRLRKLMSKEVDA